MQNGDEASPSIILAGWALLVKMLITLEPHGIFASNFVYLCILTLSSHCHAKRWRGFVEHHFGRSSSFSENAHNSWTPWYIHFKFCILMYFNIVRPLPCKTVTRLCRASFWPVKPLKWRASFWSSSFSENAHLYTYVFKHCIVQWLVQPLVCKTVTRLHRASFWLVELF